MTTCPCGATWTGKRLEHCPTCHETFSGTSAGDRHRVGEHHLFYGPHRRRCLTGVEMAAKGMVRNERGVWTLGGANPWAGARQDGPEGSPEGEGLGATNGALRTAHGEGER